MKARICVIITFVLLAVLLVACSVPVRVVEGQGALAEETADGCGPGSVCVTVTPIPTPTCPCPTCPVVGPTPTGTPVTPTATPQPSKPACWDPYLDTLGVTVERRNGEWELVAAWTTTNGQWDPVIACAKAWQTDQLGGDHNAFARAQIDNSLPMPGVTMALIWPGGGDTRITDGTGWNNMPLAGQNWNPANGPGPYTMFVFGGDKLNGFGMPNNQHVSFFGVWQRKPSLQEFDSKMMGAAMPQSSIGVTQSAATQTGGRMIGVEIGGLSGTVNIYVTVP